VGYIAESQDRVRIFKTKEFARFARRERIDDARLCDAVERAGKGLIDADLGGGLIKQRIARPRQGRSGGYRTLMAFRPRDRTVFVYGFAKSERDNIDREELGYWQAIARSFLQMDGATVALMIDQQELREVNRHGESQHP
jgi:hypothetical protein